MRWTVWLCLGFSSVAHSFSWQDLWLTHDQQAKAMMQQGQYPKAQGLFENKDWKATAAYRAGNYADAANAFYALRTEDGYYNQGNALAHMAKYEESIAAYNKALAMNPNNQDALYNRAQVEEMLKKDKQNQDKQNQDKQNQDKQNQDKQNQDKQNQDKQNQDKQNQDKQNQDKQNQDKQNQDKQNQDKQNQDKQNQDKQNQDKQNQEDTKESSSSDLEAQRAKEQWLRLIPDDPGGLTREKFLRDHLRRQRGWYQ